MSAEGVHSDHLVVHQDGCVVIEWPYSHIGTFTATVAAQAELEAPGTGAAKVTRFRQQILDADLAPDSLRLRIVRDPVSCDSPQQARAVFDMIASACADGGVGQVDDERQTLTVTMGELRACNSVQKLRQLQRRGQITCVADNTVATTSGTAPLGAFA